MIRDASKHKGSYKQAHHEHSSGHGSQVTPVTYQIPLQNNFM